MNIGIDIDDTICDSWENVINVICSDFNLDYDSVIESKKIYHELTGLSKEGYYEYAKKYKILLKNPKLKGGAQSILKELSKENKIIFITARLDRCYDDAYKFTKEYLDKNKIPYDKIIVNAINKREICKNEKIDIFIDDSINNCISVNDLGIKVILFENYFNENCTIFKKAKNWKEVFEVIKEEINARKTF